MTLLVGDIVDKSSSFNASSCKEVKKNRIRWTWKLFQVAWFSFQKKVPVFFLTVELSRVYRTNREHVASAGKQRRMNDHDFIISYISFLLIDRIS